MHTHVDFFKNTDVEVHFRPWISRNLIRNYRLQKLSRKFGKKSFVVNKTHDKAKLSKLEYEVIGYYKDKTIVKVNLITGRHHQIRVQFKNIGYPLLGDQLYGNKNIGNRMFRVQSFVCGSRGRFKGK